MKELYNNDQVNKINLLLQNRCLVLFLNKTLPTSTYCKCVRVCQYIFTYRRVFFIVERPLVCACGVPELCKTLSSSVLNVIDLLQCPGELENSLKLAGALCSCTCTSLEISQRTRDIPQRAEFKAFVKLVQILRKAGFHLLVGS